MNKKGRPLGSQQKRNEAKYWLPEGITLVSGQTERYTKETKLRFNDPEYGEFISSFKAIQDANASTHYKAVQKRREQTNLIKYGGTNPSHSEEVRKKAQETTMKNYGVPFPNMNKNVMKKVRNTYIERYGFSHPSKNPKHVENYKKSLFSKYGVDNPMKSPELRKKQYDNTLKNGNMFVSSGEREIKNFIEELGLKTTSKFLYDGTFKRSIDIFIEELNIAIEYNGLYWHSEANKKMYPKYHLEKTKLCEKHGVRLIQVFEHEWLDRKDQVKSFLRSALGKNEIRIFARNTEIREVEKKTAKEFLETYHILGECEFNKAFGLYYKDELVAMTTFGLHHWTSGEMILSRFITKTNYNVLGGLSKLVNKALDVYKCDIATWIDLRWSNGSNWVKSGWQLVHVLNPDYFYFDNKTGNIVSKQSRRKSTVNTPVNMTEHEHALLDKLYRIYDCGKIKLQIKL